MTYSSSLTDENVPLVLDTSVLINLHACGHGARILATIPNSIFVPQVVAGELEHETSRTNGERSFLHGLADDGIVTVAEMTDDEFNLFARLISGTGSLGDGEAATIAIAATRSHLPIIDEKKGRARAETLLDGQQPAWSLCLLRHPVVLQHLEAMHAIEALYRALRDGRMRIPSSAADDIIAEITPQRAADCPCLPGYRGRFPILSAR